MEYLVNMTTHVPDGTPDQAVDDIRAREAAHSRELAAAGHLLRLWHRRNRVNGVAGRSPPRTAASRGGPGLHAAAGGAPTRSRRRAARERPGASAQ
jgi:hypothetical protein